MKKLLTILFVLASFASFGQLTNNFTGIVIKNSHATDSSGINKIWYHAATGKFRFWDGGGKHTFGVGTGGGGVSFPLTSSQLTINNPAATFSYTFTAAAIAAARTITLPLLAGNDVMVTADFIQTLNNKTLGTSTIGVTQVTGTNSTTLATTAFVQQEITANLLTFPLSSSQLKINNPAATFAYTFTAAAIAAARTITLPLLTGNDVMVTADFTQTLTNKTLSSNTIGITQTTGDNSTKLATTAYVEGYALPIPLSLANGGTETALTDPAAHAIMGWDNTGNIVRFMTIGSGLTYTQATNTLSASGGGGGITNTAANTELMMSDGTNAVPSSLFYASRTLTMGTAVAGATITLQAAGSATDVGFNIFNKGAGSFQFNGTGSTLANHFFNQTNSLTVNHYSTDATGVFLVLSKFRGTGASPTTVANGDVLGNLDFQGYDGTSTINSARIKAVLNGTISTGVTPTDIVFQTTATNTVVDAMKISSLGVVSLTGNATQAGQLRLYEDTDDGTNFSSFKVGVQPADLTYTLPNAAAASNGSYMSTTTAGVMSWTEALTPSNGLTTTSTTLKLGGALTASTTISGAFDMTFTTNTITQPSTTITQAALTTGWVPAMKITPGTHTSMTASTEFPDFKIEAATHTWATGTLATQRAVYFGIPTAAFNSASTITNAYGLWVEPYTAGTNATITSNWAAGFNGPIKVVGAVSATTSLIAGAGEIFSNTAGYGISLKEGTNARMGTATANGTTEVTVNTTTVTSSSRIFIFCESGCSGVSGSYYVSARTAGTSFGFKAAATDTGTVAWIIFEPVP